MREFSIIIGLRDGDRDGTLNSIILYNSISKRGRRSME
jgi:hypothetical protein